MKSLFAPWRMVFIEGPKDQEECVFCKIPNADLEVHQVLEKGKHCFVVMNKFPYSNGHLMVIPYRHEKNWTALTEDEALEMHRLTQKALRALEKALKPNGFNLGANLGRAAGAGIEMHIHQHIVPRWNGDFNFMPLIGETKVISEHLEATYQRIREVWG